MTGYIHLCERCYGTGIIYFMEYVRQNIFKKTVNAKIEQCICFDCYGTGIWSPK